MKKLLYAVAVATCAALGANAVDLPSWAVGTWAGRMVSHNSADPDIVNEGFYEMTLGSSGGEKERFAFDGDTTVSRNVEWYDQTIIDQDDCHVVMTCWYWNTSHDAKYTAKTILRKEGCSHYDKSSCSESIEDGDWCEVKELTKLEMNTVPAEGWPEWVVGTWSGEYVYTLTEYHDGRTVSGDFTTTLNLTGVYTYVKMDLLEWTTKMKGWKIVDLCACHVVVTCWYWPDGFSDWFNVKFVFRNTACGHYAKSSSSWVENAGHIHGKDTCEIANLKKDGGDPAPSVPYVAGDDGATVTGDAETGFVVTPSEDAEAVVVTIPSGVDAAKVTVRVSPETQTVTPNGAAVKVVRGEADITDHLDIPAADASGVIDLNAATVKAEIVKEPLDAAKGAVIDFASPEAPTFTTAPTREGLVYRLKEGATLEAMAADTTGATKVGDGTSWTPKLSVSGGTSGFYTIQVTK